VKTLKYDAELYGHEYVREALLTAQHGKCAFCESKFGHIAPGDVEHFRPKSGWRQKQGEPLQRPGYYWLTYEWTNLFMACPLCNQRFKQNLFPLRRPARRARNHTQDLQREEPLLLDPGSDDPEAHIAFRGAVPFAINGNLRGKTTIQILGLGREALLERRRERVDLLMTLSRLVKLGGPEAAPAREHLQRMQRDDAEYASMSRGMLRALGLRPAPNVL
jgi:uncharacterized protein (TIGR02646 family)